MIFVLAMYLMIGCGTYITMRSSDFDFGVMVFVNAIFWPVFWSSMITVNLMDK
jgi:hypothetical protein